MYPVLISDVTDGYVHSDLFATELAMPEWEALITIVSLTLVIIITVVGVVRSFVYDMHA